MKLLRDIRPEAWALLTAFFILVWVVAATEAHAHQFDASDAPYSASRTYIFWSVFVRGPAIVGTILSGILAVHSWKKSQ
jgi:hypothetical protein